MPRLWNDTIEEHRRAVGDAILDTTAALVAEHGPASVTMSAIAERTGIGRATLYKYFPDVESIVLAWHERQVGRHLAHLVAVRDGTPGGRLEAVLRAYALIRHQHHDDALAAALHRGEHVADAQLQLREMLRELLSGEAAAGAVRSDVPADELAAYCLHALAAAAVLPSEAAVVRLLDVTLAGLRPPA